MKIIDTKTEIIKWEQNEGVFDRVVTTGETHSLILFKHTPIYKSILTITGIFYVTCPDTDFILDTEVKSSVEFDSGGKPSINDLYSVYLDTRLKWLSCIFKQSLENGFNLWIQSPPVPIERLSPFLEKALNQAYIDK